MQECERNQMFTNQYPIPTVVKAPYNIIIYSLTADILTHQGQLWTLMSINTHAKY
jgi:hypothetical protein